jgi:two-component system nitrate/nitrite response regulator NarL
MVPSCDTPAHVLIVDDHPIVWMGLQFLLANRPALAVCGEVENGKEAIRKVLHLLPDLVILDLSMPLLNGFDAALEIKRVAPSTKIVLFSVHKIPSTAQIIGADAFVQKGSPPGELILTIQRVLQLE